MEIKIVREGALLFEFESTISISINTKVKGLYHTLSNFYGDVIELTPSYSAILVEFDPTRIAFNEIISVANDDVLDMIESDFTFHNIPVKYGGSFGEDLDLVSNHCRLTLDEIIRLHTSVEYYVYMIGFLPGFCYLGEMDRALVTPRLSTPRASITPGSVGIADAQTGIYTIDSPGGWNIIGHTDYPLLDFNSNDPCKIKWGDRILFRSV